MQDEQKEGHAAEEYVDEARSEEHAAPAVPGDHRVRIKAQLFPADEIV